MLCRVLVIAALLCAPDVGQAAASDLWQVGLDFVVRADAAALHMPAGRADLLNDVETAARKACRKVRPRVRTERCQAESTAATEAQLPGSARSLLELARAERGPVRLADARSRAAPVASRR